MARALPGLTLPWIVLGCSTGTLPLEMESLDSAVIYGSDSRVEALDFHDVALVGLITGAVGAVIPRHHLEPHADGWRLVGPTLAEEVGLCEDEPFGEQLRVSICTATLVAPKMIVTAGHCWSSDRDLAFVRGFVLNDKFPTIPYEDVFDIDEPLVVLDGTMSGSTEEDIAFAEIASDAAPPTVRLTSTKHLAVGDSLLVVGTSEGVPMKVDDGAKVHSADDANFFEMTSDTFEGGSGSPVLSSGGELLGILIAGAPDYVWREREHCAGRAIHPAPQGRGEVAIRSEFIQNHLDVALTVRNQRRSDKSSHPNCALDGSLRRANAHPHHLLSIYAVVLVLLTRLFKARQ